MNFVFLVKFSLINLLLLLGILNPQGFLDVFLSYFLLGVLQTYFLRYQFKVAEGIGLETKKISYFIFVLSIVFSLLSIFNWKSVFINVAALSLILGIALSNLFFSQISKRSVILVFSIILIFIFTSRVNSGDLRRSISFEPVAETYFTDYFSFLKVFFLVERGYGYYSAHVKTHLEDARFDYVPQQVWGWRLPIYVYLWRIFPGSGGVSVYIFFIVLSSTALFFSYRIAKIFIGKKLAILSPYLVYPYFHFAARDVAFFEMEWWSICILIIGIYYFIRKKIFIAFLFFTVTVLIREIFIIPLISVAVASLLYRQIKQFISFIFVGIIFIAFLSLHFIKVTEYIPRTFQSLAPRDHPIGLIFLQQTLSYSSWEYLFFNLRPFLFLLLINLISTTILFIRKMLNFELTILFFSAFSLMIAISKIGTPLYDDYWGVSYVPLILIFSPIFIFTIFKNMDLKHSKINK